MHARFSRRIQRLARERKRDVHASVYHESEGKKESGRVRERDRDSTATETHTCLRLTLLERPIFRRLFLEDPRDSFSLPLSPFFSSPSLSIFPTVIHGLLHPFYFQNTNDARESDARTYCRVKSVVSQGFVVERNALFEQRRRRRRRQDILIDVNSINPEISSLVILLEDVR